MKTFKRVLAALGVVVILVAGYTAVRYLVWKDNRVDDFVASLTE